MIRIDFDVRNLRNIRIGTATTAANPAVGLFTPIFTNTEQRLAIVLAASLEGSAAAGGASFAMRDPSGLIVAVGGAASLAANLEQGTTYPAPFPLLVPPRWDFGFLITVAPGVGNTATGRAEILELLITSETRDLERAGAGG